MADADARRRIVISGHGHHIPAGEPSEDGTWRPTLCGGGVPNPGPETKVPAASVCPDCMQVVADTGHPWGMLAERMAVAYQGEADSLWARNLHRHGMLRVLTLLEAEGWGPYAEALTAERAEVERLRGLAIEARAQIMETARDAVTIVRDAEADPLRGPDDGPHEGCMHAHDKEANRGS